MTLGIDDVVTKLTPSGMHQLVDVPASKKGGGGRFGFSRIMLKLTDQCDADTARTLKAKLQEVITQEASKKSSVLEMVKLRNEMEELKARPWFSPWRFSMPKATAGGPSMRMLITKICVAVRGNSQPRTRVLTNNSSTAATLVEI